MGHCGGTDVGNSDLSYLVLVMVLGELKLSRFRLREAGFAGSSAAQVGLVGPVVNIRSNIMRFVTNFLGHHFMSPITIAYKVVIIIVTWSEAKSILSS